MCRGLNISIQSLYLSVLMLSAAPVMAGNFKVGDKVQATDQGAVIPGTITKSEGCYFVDFEDGSKGLQPKSTLVPQGKTTAKRGSIQGKPGEKVSALWSDGQWWNATLGKAEPCSLVKPNDASAMSVWVSNNLIKKDDGKAAAAPSSTGMFQGAKPAASAGGTGMFQGANPAATKSCHPRGTDKSGTFHDGICNSWTAEKISACRKMNESDCRSSSSRGNNCQWLSSGKCGVPSLD